MDLTVASPVSFEFQLFKNIIDKCKLQNSNNSYFFNCDDTDLLNQFIKPSALAVNNVCIKLLEIKPIFTDTDFTVSYPLHNFIFKTLQLIGNIAGMNSILFKIFPKNKDKEYVKVATEHFKYFAGKVTELKLPPIEKWQHGIDCKPAVMEAAKQDLVQVSYECIKHFFNYIHEHGLDIDLPQTHAPVVKFKIPNQQSDSRLKYAYLGDNQALIDVHYGSHLVMDLRDNSVMPTVLKTGWYEPWIDILIHSIVNENDIVVDVGANFGYHTNHFANLVGPKGKVYAYECNPTLIPLLIRSLFINGFTPRVNLYNAAATNKFGELAFTFCAEQVGGGTTIDIEEEAKKIKEGIEEKSYPGGLISWGSCWHGYKAATVQAVTLDGTVGKEVEAINVLHIDAEGAEPYIINGARDLIKRSKKLAIIMEWPYNDRERTPGYQALYKDVLQFFVDQGFQFYMIQPPKGDVYKKPPNLLKLSIEQLLEVPHCDIFITRPKD